MLILSVYLLSHGGASESFQRPCRFAGWEPGQFGQFTVFGAGESVFALANAPWRPNGDQGSVPTIECTFRMVGKVTSALRAMSKGQVIGFRGPYGNHFPVDDWKGRDLVFIGGGIGMAALRSARDETVTVRGSDTAK